MTILLCINVVIILLLSVGTFSFYKKSLVSEIAAARSDVLRQVSERVHQFKTNIHTLSNLYYTDARFQQMASALDEENADSFLSTWMGSRTSFRSRSTR